MGNVYIPLAYAVELFTADIGCCLYDNFNEMYSSSSKYKGTLKHKMMLNNWKDIITRGEMMQ